MAKKRKTDISYNAFGFDIETSTVKDKDGDDVSFMYIGTFGLLNLENGNIQKYAVIRTWREFDNILEELNAEAQNKNEIYLLYCHNNYEWQFIKNNSKFFMQYFRKGEYKVLFKTSKRPLTVRVGNIELRDSLLLLNRSIRVLGDELGVEKLDYRYEVTRYPWDELTQLDYDYNWRDVEIQLKALYKLYVSEPYIEKPADIPLTQTGRTRKNNRWDKRITNSGKNGADVLRSWDSKCRREFPKSSMELEQQIKTSKGGYVHANAFFVGQVRKNVHSFDLGSAHPSQTLNRLFPAELPAIADSPNEKFNEIVQSVYDKYNRINALKPQPFELYLVSHYDFTWVGFHAVITLAGVKCKIDRESKNYMPTISVSKCTDILKPVVDNGRVIEAKALTLYCDYISFFQYSLTYDFDVINVSDLYFYQLKAAHTFTKSCVKVYAKEKTAYKKARNVVRDERRTLTKAELNRYNVTDELAINRIISASTWEEQVVLLSDYLLISKQKLNAQYGINMQNPINDEFECIEEGDTLEWEGHIPSFEAVKKNNHKTNYLFGMYMPINTQLELTCATVYIMNNSKNLHILYWDTDSMKIEGDLAEAQKLINDFNTAWKRGGVRLNGELFEGLGMFDYEETYDCFSSIGCKRYLTAERDGESYLIHATISGLTRASEIYQEMFNQCKSFEKLVKTAFKLNTKFDKSAVDGLTTYYTTCGKEIDFLDDVKSGVVLKKADFDMNKIVGDTTCIELSKYYHLTVQKYFKNDVDTSKTIITRKKELKINLKNRKLNCYNIYYCNGKAI